LWHFGLLEASQVLMVEECMPEGHFQVPLVVHYNENISRAMIILETENKLPSKTEGKWSMIEMSVAFSGKEGTYTSFIVPVIEPLNYVYHDVL
jgi:hypothetical protein